VITGFLALVIVGDDRHIRFKRGALDFGISTGLQMRKTHLF